MTDCGASSESARDRTASEVSSREGCALSVAAGHRVSAAAH